jgi:6,7-dimethyl-8-ribityllumazine synthase
MAEARALPIAGRIGVVVSRYNESVTTRLLQGARLCLAERGVDESRVDVVWVAGAWELPVAARALLVDGAHDALCALGAVVRGETPHFDFVAGESARGLMDLQLEFGVPIGFGLLTTDTMAQAVARAGGEAGNKGYEAMAAALDAAAAIGRRDAHSH